MHVQHRPLGCLGHQQLKCSLWSRGLRQAQTAGSSDASRRSLVLAATSSVASAPEAFSRLLQSASITGVVELRGTNKQHGLFTTQPCSKGQILLSVPRHLAIVVDYNSGLSVGEGPWPRLREGVVREDALPWDLLQALALVDAAAGQGDAFWQEYSQSLLPRPQDLTLPMCWSPARLAQLQHDAIINGALAQQARLAAMFPQLSEPIGPDAPSRMQWALACIKSRAFKVGDEAFAYIPFLDMANHTEDPSTDFRPSAAGSGDAAAGATFDLFAMRDLAAGEEATTRYSGVEGYTNQRWMAQYGFVPTDGNPSDRLTFTPAQCSPDAGPPCTMDLGRWQSALGDSLFAEVANRKLPVLYAALRSLPIVEEEGSGTDEAYARGDVHQQRRQRSRQQQRQRQAQEQRELELGAEQDELELVDDLRRQCTELLAGCATSVEEDEALLMAWGLAPQAAGAPAAPHGTTTAPAAAARASVDPRDVAAVQYRLERKRLAKACRSLLDVYRRALLPDLGLEK